MKITRRNETDYAVITDTPLADGSYRADDCCRLSGTALHSHEQAGHIRIGGLLRVELGPKSFAAVRDLAIGETLNLQK